MSAPILIWGAGAIGGTIGAWLAREGVEVVFVDVVPEHVDAINAHGLAIEGPIGVGKTTLAKRLASSFNYQTLLEDARRALAQAERDLERARLQPPTTSLAEAEAELARAMDREAEAADSYKQALDRPWEPQEIRESLYKDWQASIADRELAQLRLDDAQVAVRVHNLDLAAKGRMKIDWAEARMPVMMALREEHAKLQSLKGMRIAGCLHVTKETAVLVETLKAAGAEISWSGCNPLSTQDEVAAALAAAPAAAQGKAK